MGFTKPPEGTVITEDEAIAQGADDFDIALGFMEGYKTTSYTFRKSSWKHCCQTNGYIL